MPHAEHRLGLEPPAVHRQPLDHRAHLVEVGAGVESEPSAMSPAMPEKQWNQASRRRHLSIRSTAQAAP